MTRISKKLHLQLKIIAATKGVDIADIVRDLLKEYVKENQNVLKSISDI